MRLIQKVVEMLRVEAPDGIGWQTTLNDSNLAVQFEKAERLLRASEKHLREPVCAYQLFTPDEGMLSAREIAKRFTEAGWSAQGVGHVQLRKKFLTLLKFAEQEISARLQLRYGLLEEEPNGDGSVLSLHKKIWMGLSAFIDSLSIPMKVLDRDLLKSTAIQQFERLLDVHLTENLRAQREDPEATLSLTSFIKYACGYDSVEEFETSKEEKKAVRAYELFVFAHQSDLFPESFTASITNRGALRSPIRRSPLSILKSHDGVDEALEVWAKAKSKFRSTPLMGNFLGQHSGLPSTATATPPP